MNGKCAPGQVHPWEDMSAHQRVIPLPLPPEQNEYWWLNVAISTTFLIHAFSSELSLLS